MNFYRSAALALDHLDKNQGSVKGSLAAARVNAEPAEAKRILALIIETLKYRTVLQQLLETVPLLRVEKETFRKKASPSSLNLVLVLLHDLLFSAKHKIEASDKWPPKMAVIRHQARLKAELVRLQIKAGKSSVRELGKEANSTVEARYVRWNPNVDLCRADDWSLPALEAHLVARGMKKLEKPLYPVPPDSYFFDPHLSDCLLVFPPSSTWWVGDKWYDSGAIILQDKASCFPAHVIMDGWEDDGECIDATAAPGNKTSFMSALMGNRGTLYAFEKSPNRFTTLSRMLEKGSCTNVQATRGDFLEAIPGDYPDVTRILLDPSCSGSGIVNRLDYLVEQESEESDDQTERLEKLASFQLQMIQHAFTFPAVQRVVYSTCSIHPEEDERVVTKALETTGWRLAPRSSVLPTWERRGRQEELGDLADCVVRCLPEDKTNGFFVACFERDDGTNIKKRAREESDVEGDGDESDVVGEGGGGDSEILKDDTVTKAKTSAQAERLRRKRREQKKRRKVNAPS